MLLGSRDTTRVISASIKKPTSSREKGHEMSWARELYFLERGWESASSGREDSLTNDGT